MSPIYHIKHYWKHTPEEGKNGDKNGGKNWGMGPSPKNAGIILRTARKTAVFSPSVKPPGHFFILFLLASATPTSLI